MPHRGEALLSSALPKHCRCVLTTRHAEYLIVVDPTKLNGPLSGMDARLPSDQANPTGARVPKPPSEFALKLDARNEQLEDIDIGKLCMQEFHAARLYTGPMFMKYNAVLRGLGEKGLPNSGKALEDRMTELCVDSRYVTTLHCINSAIVKLSRLAKPQTVYRGLSGRVLPSEFWRGQGHGGVEFAFMSTTADRKVAMQYAKAESEKKASCVMEVQMGMIDRGADLSWLSQYPDEHEITFPPYTGLEVVNTRVEGSVLVVELRLNVNLMSPTIEAAVAKMRSAHLQLLDIIHSNLRAANAPEQLLKSLKGLKGSEQGKEPDYFNRVQNFRDATEMALDTQHEGFLALHDKTMWEREHKNKHAIPEKMRVAAIMCSRSGEHEVALSLLRQAYLRTVELHGAQQAQTQMTGGIINSTDFHGHLRRMPSSLKMANAEELIHNELAAIEQAEEWKLRLAMHLVQSEIPSPWPATLCRLATPTTSGKFSLELSGTDLQTNEATCNAIIAVIKAALEHQLISDNLGTVVGLPGLRKDAHVLALVSQQWRKAQAVESRCGSLFIDKDATALFAEPKELALARTVKVNEPQGDQPPTITLDTKEGKTYQVQWTFAEVWQIRQGDRNPGKDAWPAAGMYVITELLEGTVQITHLEDHPFGKTPEGQKLLSTAGQLEGGTQHKRVGARFINPPEAFLTVAMREGGVKREYSAAAIAGGEVLIMPAPNPTVSSGAGALLREAAATGNVKLLEALLDVGVSVWEADNTATTAVHLAAQTGEEDTFKLLWSRPNPPKKPPPQAELRTKLVGPTLTFMRRNTDGKRALDYIFQNGHPMLARVTRGAASDQERKKLEEEPEEWTVVPQVEPPTASWSTAAPDDELFTRVSPGRKTCWGRIDCHSPHSPARSRNVASPV